MQTATRQRCARETATVEGGAQINLFGSHPFRLRIARVALVLALLPLGLAPASRAALAWKARPAEDPGPPVVVNGVFECSVGYRHQSGVNGLVPDGWTAAVLAGAPELNSTRIYFAGGCGEDGWIERIEGQDSLVFLSEDIETPPAPGKPFDAAVYQQVAVTPGISYSLSGWTLSLCGGSARPTDCPPDYYMSKMLGIDPTGGTDPLAPTVTWVEDRRNFPESGWVNLRMGTTAQSPYMTLFARIRSPLRWHGNHAFVDAFSLVRAPTANFVALPATVQGNHMTVRWAGVQSPDISAIPGGTYELLFEIQYRLAGDTAWADWQTGRPAGEAVFTASCQADKYEFRLRARSEQPAGSGGAWPNQRYPGDWSAPASVEFMKEPCPPRAYMPLVTRQ
jgi:hypothetical protein